MEISRRADDGSIGNNDAIRVRCAVPADLGDLIDLENASFSSDRLSPRQWKRHLGSARARILVAEWHSRTSAAAVLFFRKGSLLARLYSLAVAAGVRGHGIGETLLAVCEGVAAERGCTRLRLEVRSDNAPARRLYERRGYRLFATRAGYYEDGATAFCYEKTL